MGLVCTGGHCGMPGIDAGNCSLDPGGTPCSQCVIANCCNLTEQCLNNSQCVNNMGCYQMCAAGTGTPAQCQQQCCTGNLCNQWTNCVAGNCAALCF